MKTLRKMIKQMRDKKDTNIDFATNLSKSATKLELQISQTNNENEIFQSIGEILYNLTHITNSYHINHYNALLSQITEKNKEHYSKL